jgi:hypothetical protein
MKRTWYVVSALGQYLGEFVGNEYALLTGSLDKAHRFQSQRKAKEAAERLHSYNPNSEVVAMRVTTEVLIALQRRRKK